MTDWTSQPHNLYIAVALANFAVLRASYPERVGNNPSYTILFMIFPQLCTRTAHDKIFALEAKSKAAKDRYLNNGIWMRLEIWILRTGYAFSKDDTGKRSKRGQSARKQERRMIEGPRPKGKGAGCLGGISTTAGSAQNEHACNDSGKRDNSAREKQLVGDTVDELLLRRVRWEALLRSRLVQKGLL